MASDAGADALQLALRVIRILEDLGAPAWIGGSLASSIFGIPRATQDADIVADLRAEMVRPFIERLGEHLYADSERIREGVERRSSFNLIYLPTMFKVDVFVLGHDSRSQRELERRRHVEIGETRGSVAGQSRRLAGPAHSSPTTNAGWGLTEAPERRIRGPLCGALVVQ